MRPSVPTAAVGPNMKAPLGVTPGAGARFERLQPKTNQAIAMTTASVRREGFIGDDKRAKASMPCSADRLARRRCLASGEPLILARTW